jgi:hypothetical protein
VPDLFYILVPTHASTSVVIGDKKSSSLKLAGGHLARLLITLDFESELLPFNDRVHAGAFNGRDVNEYVRAAVVRLDEAEALCGIKPFNCASGHNKPFHSNIDHRRTTHSGYFSTFERESSS